MKSFVTLASTSHLAEGQHDLPYGQHLEHGGGGGGDDDGRGQHGEHVSVWDERGQHACGIIIEHSGTDNIKLDPVPHGQRLEHCGGGDRDDDGKGQHGEHVSVRDERGQHAYGIIIELDSVPHGQHLEHGGGGGGDDDGRGQHGEHVSVRDERGQHARDIITSIDYTAYSNYACHRNLDTRATVE